jgi:hypothetical protein
MADETYTLIQKTTVGSAGAASITFSSIPQTFTDLVVKVSARSSGSDPYEDLGIYFNNTTSNLTWRWLYGTGSAGASTLGSTRYSAITTANSATASTFGNTEIYIPNYASPNYKSFSVDSVPENNATGTLMVLAAGLWSDTAAITRIDLNPEAGNFMQYTSASLYGVSKQGVTPVAGPKASGGDIITNDGTYWIHQFLNSGTFIPSQTLSCDYLVVAGGGGGGGGVDSSLAAGGGGAGGYRTSSGLSATVQAYTVTVGAGGTAGTATAIGGNGANSVFSTITSTGGGGGGSRFGSVGEPRDGAAGGSGGGGRGNLTSDPGVLASVGGAGNSGSFSPVEGFAGGAGGGVSRTGGGGGGASEAGNTDGDGYGGDGTSNSISGSSVTYAGGGGGGQGSTGSQGLAGDGGGGAGGATNSNGTAGTVNRGGGGGGSGNTNTGNKTGGAGGSGIVIIRYAM